MITMISSKSLVVGCFYYDKGSKSMLSLKCNALMSVKDSVSPGARSLADQLTGV